VTKKEIVKQIADRFDMPQVKVKDMVQAMFDYITEALVKEGRIELRNFGVFEVKVRKARRARNPRTNEPVEVKAKNVVTFQPGKSMEERARHAETVIEPKRKLQKVSVPAGNHSSMTERASVIQPSAVTLNDDQDDDRDLLSQVIPASQGNDEGTKPAPHRPTKPR
jgi:integration host factor subunit beta